MLELLVEVINGDVWLVGEIVVIFEIPDEAKVELSKADVVEFCAEPVMVAVIIVELLLVIVVVPCTVIVVAFVVLLVV